VSATDPITAEEIRDYLVDGLDGHHYLCDREGNETRAQMWADHSDDGTVLACSLVPFAEKPVILGRYRVTVERIGP